MNVHYRRLKHYVPGVGDILLTLLQEFNGRQSRPADDTPIAKVVDLEILEDGTGSMEKVRTLVANGELVPDDLVDLGRGWESVGDVVEFDDCRPPAASDQTGGKLAVALLLLALGLWLLSGGLSRLPPMAFARWQLPLMLLVVPSLLIWRRVLRGGWEQVLNRPDSRRPK